MSFVFQRTKITKAIAITAPMSQLSETMPHVKATVTSQALQTEIAPAFPGRK